MFPSPFKLNGSNSISTNSIPTPRSVNSNNSNNSISTNTVPTLRPFNRLDNNSNNSNNSNTNNTNSINIDTPELDLLLAHPKFNNLISNHIQLKLNQEYNIFKNTFETTLNEKLLIAQERIKLEELKEQLNNREIFLNNLFNTVNQKLKQNTELQKNIQIQTEKLNVLKRKHTENSTNSNNNIVKIRKLNSTQRQAFENDNDETETDSDYEDININNNSNVTVVNNLNDENKEEIPFQEVNVPNLTNVTYEMEGTFDDKHWIIKIDNKYTVIPLLRTVEPLLTIYYKQKFSTHTFTHKKQQFKLFEDYVKLSVKLHCGKRYILCLTGKGLLKLISFIPRSTEEENNKVLHFINKYNCLHYFSQNSNDNNETEFTP
jgi:hypothetical protein